jgi:predicted Zn-dependent protease
MNHVTHNTARLVTTICEASVITTAAVVLNLASAAVARETRPHLTITIHVYNYAEVPSQTLIQAEQITEAIFRKTAVEIQWLGSPLDSANKQENSSDRKSFHSSDIQLNILPRPMSESFGPSRDLGFALGVGPNPEVAYVFYDRAERLARQQIAEKRLRETSTGIAERRAEMGQILGNIVAHELGHLLGLCSHPRTGIMRADWNLTDLQDIACGYFLFTSEQGEVIRAEVSRRIQPQKASDQQASAPNFRAGGILKKGIEVTTYR